MEVCWESDNNLYKQIYWCDKLSLEEFENYMDNCDYIRVWYSNNVSDDIYKKYKELIHFVELDGHWKGTATSIVIDLTLSDDDILNGFSKTKRYEARRALERDNLQVSFKSEYSEDAVYEYEVFYNHFAEEKKLPRLSSEKVSSMMKQGQFAIAKVSDSEGELMVVHGYIMDKELKRAALFSSSSLYRENKDKAALISRANIFLHYKCMLIFKQLCFTEYDLGGLYLGKEIEGTNDHINVSKFKRSLGGNIIKFESGFDLSVKEIKNINCKLKKYCDLLHENKVIIWGAGSLGQYIIRILYEHNVIPKCVIDNYLRGYEKQDILKKYNEEDTVILVTTSDENFKLIQNEKLCVPYVNKGKLIHIKG